MARPDELLQVALSYAGRGWPVFPLHTPVNARCSCGKRGCSSIGKHPRTPHGLKDATTDAVIIRQWWARWPAANIGLVTGEPSGLVVVDIDPRSGGDVTLEDLEAEQGPFPETVEALTGGGGRHLFYRHPRERVTSGADSLGPGVDVKADSGYVVGPPSLHASGRRYEWEVSSHPDDVPLAPLPSWFPLEQEKACDPETGQHRALDDYAGDRPGDQYNRQVTREEVRLLLIEMGWVLVEHRQGVDYFRRPGKSGKAYSGSLGYLPGNRFRCFTTNGHPFQPTRGGYTPFAVYTMAKHGGDFQAAAKALLRQRPRLTCDPWLGPRSQWHGVPAPIWKEAMR
jgi:Bifunctional DNA primase/polymerase, N-terminal